MSKRHPEIIRHSLEELDYDLSGLTDEQVSRLSNVIPVTHATGQILMRYGTLTAIDRLFIEGERKGVVVYRPSGCLMPHEEEGSLQITIDGWRRRAAWNTGRKAAIDRDEPCLRADLTRIVPNLGVRADDVRLSRKAARAICERWPTEWPPDHVSAYRRTRMRVRAALLENPPTGEGWWEAPCGIRCWLARVEVPPYHDDPEDTPPRSEWIVCLTKPPPVPEEVQQAAELLKRQRWRIYPPRWE